MLLYSLIIIISLLWIVYRVHRVFQTPVLSLIQKLHIKVPKTPSIQVHKITSTSISIHWESTLSKGSGNKYLVYVNGVSIGNTNYDQVNCVLSDLKPNSYYQIDIVAINENMFKSKSNSVYVKTYPSDNFKLHHENPQNIMMFLNNEEIPNQDVHEDGHDIIGRQRSATVSSIISESLDDKPSNATQKHKNKYKNNNHNHHPGNNANHHSNNTHYHHHHNTNITDDTKNEESVSRTKEIDLMKKLLEDSQAEYMKLTQNESQLIEDYKSEYAKLLEDKERTKSLKKNNEKTSQSLKAAIRLQEENIRLAKKDLSSIQNNIGRIEDEFSLKKDELEDLEIDLQELRSKKSKIEEYGEAELKARADRIEALKKQIEKIQLENSTFDNEIKNFNKKKEAKEKVNEKSIYFLAELKSNIDDNGILSKQEEVRNTLNELKKINPELYETVNKQLQKDSQLNDIWNEKQSRMYSKLQVEIKLSDEYIKKVKYLTERRVKTTLNAINNSLEKEQIKELNEKSKARKDLEEQKKLLEQQIEMHRQTNAFDTSMSSDNNSIYSSSINLNQQQFRNPINVAPTTVPNSNITSTLPISNMDTQGLWMNDTGPINSDVDTTISSPTNLIPSNLLDTSLSENFIQDVKSWRTRESVSYDSNPVVGSLPNSVNMAGNGNTANNSIATTNAEFLGALGNSSNLNINNSSNVNLATPSSIINNGPALMINSPISLSLNNQSALNLNNSPAIKLNNPSSMNLNNHALLSQSSAVSLNNAALLLQPPSIAAINNNKSPSGMNMLTPSSSRAPSLFRKNSDLMANFDAINMNQMGGDSNTAASTGNNNNNNSNNNNNATSRFFDSSLSVMDLHAPGSAVRRARSSSINSVNSGGAQSFHTANFVSLDLSQEIWNPIIQTSMFHPMSSMNNDSGANDNISLNSNVKMSADSHSIADSNTNNGSNNNNNNATNSNNGGASSHNNGHHHNHHRLFQVHHRHLSNGSSKFDHHNDNNSVVNNNATSSNLNSSNINNVSTNTVKNTGANPETESGSNFFYHGGHTVANSLLDPNNIHLMLNNTQNEALGESNGRSTWSGFHIGKGMFKNKDEEEKEKEKEKEKSRKSFFKKSTPTISISSEFEGNNSNLVSPLSNTMNNNGTVGSFHSGYANSSAGSVLISENEQNVMSPTTKKRKSLFSFGKQKIDFEVPLIDDSNESAIDDSDMTFTNNNVTSSSIISQGSVGNMSHNSGNNSGANNANNSNNISKTSKLFPKGMRSLSMSRRNSTASSSSHATSENVGTDSKSHGNDLGNINE